MQRVTLGAVGVFSLGSALYIWAAPAHWYAGVPGVDQTGPLNVHFAKDIALIFLTSGSALIWSCLRADKTAAFCGAAWLVLHALFHIWIWMHRGMPADLVAITNLAGIQLPAFLALWASITLDKDRSPT